MNRFQQNNPLLNHFELKYLLTLKQAETFKTALSAHVHPDKNGDTQGFYAIANLYYDAPDFRCYMEKLDGIKFRRKLRIRYYETGKPLHDDSLVFVEIKQRLNRVTQKRRVPLTYAQALQLCNQQILPACSAKDQAIVEEICAFIFHYTLRPATIVRYNRQALIGTEYDGGLRITFDSQLSSQGKPLQLDAPIISVPMLNPHLSIMEIKVNDRIPYWLTDLVAKHQLQMIRISKYCCSVQTTNLNHHNPVHHLYHSESPLPR